MPRSQFELFFEFLTAAVERMERLDSQAFTGVCQFEVVDGDALHSLYVGKVDGRARVQRASHPHPTTTVRLDAATAADIANKQTVLDLHDFDPTNPAHFRKLSIRGSRELYWVLNGFFYDRRFAEELWANAAKTCAANGPLPELQRLGWNDTERLQSLLKRQVPAIIGPEGRAPQARDMWRWSPPDLIARHGSAFISMEGEEPLDVATHFARLEAGTLKYAYGITVPPEMIDEVSRPEPMPAAAWIPPLIFLGRLGRRTRLHRDVTHNLNCHIFGRKQWILCSPDDAEFVYPSPSISGFQPSNVDPETPDQELFPLFKRARLHVLTLGAGETLVLPAGWFHHVIYLDDADMSVTLRLDPRKM